MTQRRPHIYVIFVLLTVLQPAVFMLAGTVDLNRRHAMMYALLVLWLGFGSRIAWTLLLLADALPLIAASTLLLSWPWSWSLSGVLMVVTGVLLIATLLSSAMHRHLDGRGGILASRTHASQ
ncbi:MAG: hypothetical protein ACR2KV_06865 [Solirubrobacteraceae bacterium]